MFDTQQPLLTGDHMQTTCSIFSNNDIMATKKQHQQVYIDNMHTAHNDYKEIYKNPVERFSYRANLIEGTKK